jgi:hypothetical protein
MTNKEETLWRNQITQGIFKKKIVEVQTITNYRVLRNDKGITFKDIDDVVVMNQHRISQSNYTGTSYGRYARFGTGSTQSRSKTVGDVVFMRQGRPAVRFNQIADPHGVVRLAKSAKRNVTQAMKTEDKKNRLLQSEKDNDVKTRRFKQPKEKSSIVVCSQCQNENQPGSLFCNKCGAKLQNACPNCGKNNNENSLFCGQCGLNLSLQTNDTETTPSFSEPGVTEDNFLECVLPEYDIKIKYPATWHKIDKQDLKPPLVVAFRSSKETRTDPFLESVGIGIIPVTADLGTGLTPEKCADSTINSFKEKHKDFVLLESTPTTAAGLPAQQVVFASSGRKYLYVFTPRGNRVYFIIYGSEPDKYSKFLSIIEQMIISFEFIS